MCCRGVEKCRSAHKIIVTLFSVTILWSTMMKSTLVMSDDVIVPCYFIFGDSLFDNGNNNRLLTIAKSNYSPYGVDFLQGPTGRFTNGRTVADLIGELLGFEKYISPFANVTRDEITRGVNYASGGAGILDDTGLNLGQVISLNKQLVNHQVTTLSLAFLLGGKNAAQEYLNKCFYLVGMGGNDYLNNYLLPQYYPTSTLYSPDQFSTLLIQQYSLQLQSLYSLGARKVAVVSLGPVGAIPKFRGNASVGDYVNSLVQIFDDDLKTLVDNLNDDFSDAKFIYINTTSVTSGDPDSAGITVVDRACCNVSPTSGLCVPGEIPCSNREEYAFYDDMHPTEIINKMKASRSYKAVSKTDAYPFDISHLLHYFNSTTTSSSSIGATLS